MAITKTTVRPNRTESVRQQSDPFYEGFNALRSALNEKFGGNNSPRGVAAALRKLRRNNRTAIYNAKAISADKPNFDRLFNTIGKLRHVDGIAKGVMLVGPDLREQSTATDVQSTYGFNTAHVQSTLGELAAERLVAAARTKMQYDALAADPEQGAAFAVHKAHSYNWNGMRIVEFPETALSDLARSSEAFQQGAQKALANAFLKDATVQVYIEQLAASSRQTEQATAFLQPVMKSVALSRDGIGSLL